MSKPSIRMLKGVAGINFRYASGQVIDDAPLDFMKHAVRRGTAVWVNEPDEAEEKEVKKPTRRKRTKKTK